MTSVRSVTFEVSGPDSLLRWRTLSFKEPVPNLDSRQGQAIRNEYGYSCLNGEGKAYFYNAVILRTPPEVVIWRASL
jgi:hypothetical protein